MLSGWLTRGSEGCDVSVRGLFKLIVGVRWMIGAILSCDPNKWWRCKVSLNICSLYLLCSIWGAVIASSLIRGCKTFLACHGQSRADNTPAVYWAHGNYRCKIRIPFSHHHLECIPSPFTTMTFTQSQIVNILNFTICLMWQVCSDPSQCLES